jgi:hypothetical protein
MIKNQADENIVSLIFGLVRLKRFPPLKTTA